MDNAAKDIAQKILSELRKIYTVLTDLLADNPGKNNKQPIDPASKAHDENATSPINTAAASRSVHNAPSPDSSKKTENGWQGALQRRKLPLEMIGIAFAIAYAIITFFQWREAHNDFRVDEQSWIGILEAASQPPNLDASIYRFSIVFANYGKTPARDVSCKGKFGLSKKGQEPNAPREIKTAPTLHWGMIMPTAKTILPVDVSFKPDQLQDMKSGNQIFNIFGQITYRDIFGRPHCTNFCVSLQPTTPLSFSQCETKGYNDAN